VNIAFGSVAAAKEASSRALPGVDYFAESPLSETLCMANSEEPFLLVAQWAPRLE